MDERPEDGVPDAKPFDERAALEELEQVRREIERYQALRQEVTLEFDRFLHSFKRAERPPLPAPPSAPVLVEVPRIARPMEPPIAPPVEQPIAPPVERPIAPPVAAPLVSPVPPPVVQSVAPPLAQPLTPEPVPITAPPVHPESPAVPPTPVDPDFALDLRSDESFESFAPDEAFAGLAPPLEASPLVVTAPPPKPSHKALWLVVGGAVGILAVGGYAWTLRNSREVPSSSPQPAPTPVPAPTPAASEPVAPAAPAPAAPAPVEPAPSPFESELVTTEPAWVRLIADGQKLFERELAAGTRIPFRAEKTIQIRAGNAGAVRLIMGGVDKGPVGREGEVITRSFTVSR